jgi:hypothetical protein
MAINETSMRRLQSDQSRQHPCCNPFGWMLDRVWRGGSGWLGMPHYFSLLALQALTVTYEVFSNRPRPWTSILRLRLTVPTDFFA